MFPLSWLSSAPAKDLSNPPSPQSFLAVWISCFSLSFPCGLGKLVKNIPAWMKELQWQGDSRIGHLPTQPSLHLFPGSFQIFFQ